MKEVKLNAQQMVKTQGFLECWVPDPGHVWVQLDVVALEPTCTAYLSKCPNYYNLYGSGQVNDVYLYVGSKLPQFADKFREFYDPDNPTVAGIAACKSKFKQERSICKVLVLSCGYGAGPNKIHKTLGLSGIDVEFEDIQAMHQIFWSDELFAVVRKYERRLATEWSRRGGWIRNGLGRPITIAEDKIKDILNRQMQSTGHDCLQWLIHFIYKEAERRGIKELYPVIPDIHDETVAGCPEHLGDEVCDVFRVGMNQLNEMLGWDIEIKGEPQIVHNFAEIKVED